MKRSGVALDSLISRKASYLLLALASLVLFAACAGRQGVSASESWSGVNVQPGADVAFVGTRDGRILGLIGLSATYEYDLDNRANHDGRPGNPVPRRFARMALQLDSKIPLKISGVLVEWDTERGEH